MYVLILPLVVVSGLVFANRGIKSETPEKLSLKPLSIPYKNGWLEDGRKKWESTPDGVKFKKWEASPEGKKVRANHDRIRKYLTAFSNMEAVITSVTFQRENSGPTGPKWLVVKINGEDYMMQYTRKEFQQLSGLKVGDKIIVKSRSAGYSPSHPHLIISGDYIELNEKILFKRDFSKDGC